jgi:tetratricopeptide (TPR) repeat protein
MKTKLIISLLLAVLIFVSCSKNFLRLSPVDTLNSADFYKTESHFRQAISAVYSSLQDYVNAAYVMEEIRSDNTTIDYSMDGGQLARYMPVDQFYIVATNEFSLNAWRIIYSAINRVNIPLSRLDASELDSGTKEHIRAELKFLRAFFYFVAVRYWGDIPLITIPPANPDEAFSALRMSKVDVYAQIMQDLDDAISLLPVSYSASADRGRATKGAALAVAGKVQLTLGDYAKSEAYFRQILDLGYQLLPNYREVFNPANKNHAESIFEAQYKEGDEGEHSAFMYYFAPRQTTKVINRTGNTMPLGLNIPTNDLLQSYETGDSRKETSVGFDTIRTNYVGFDTTIVVPYCRKYNFSHAAQGRTGVNWPLIRYADVLLLLAESINEQRFSPDRVVELINPVRVRAGLEPLTPTDLPSQTIARETILHERRVELAFENHRWFDLLRTNHAVETMISHGDHELANPATPFNPARMPTTGFEYKVQPYMLLYPIPEQERIVNPKLTQNERY